MEFFFHEIDKDVLILSADGGLNAHTADEFVRQLDALVDGGVSKIIVDCAPLTFISSYGIGLLVRMHNKLAARGGDACGWLPLRFRRGPVPSGSCPR